MYKKRALFVGKVMLFFNLKRRALLSKIWIIKNRIIRGFFILIKVFEKGYLSRGVFYIGSFVGLGRKKFILMKNPTEKKNKD